MLARRAAALGVLRPILETQRQKRPDRARRRARVRHDNHSRRVSGSGLSENTRNAPFSAASPLPRPSRCPCPPAPLRHAFDIRNFQRHAHRHARAGERARQPGARLDPPRARSAAPHRAPARSRPAFAAFAASAPIPSARRCVRGMIATISSSRHAWPAVSGGRSVPPAPRSVQYPPSPARRRCRSYCRRRYAASRPDTAGENPRSDKAAANSAGVVVAPIRSVPCSQAAHAPRRIRCA